MEKNNNNNDSEINEIYQSKLKSETKEAVNEVKAAFKRTDFKNELSNLKKFCVDFVKSPISTVKSIASGERNGIVIAIVLLVIMILLNVISDAIYYGMSEYMDITAKIVVLDIISPIVLVAVFSVTTYFLSGKEKKGITTVISSIIISFAPIIIRMILYIIYTLISEALSIYFIYSMFSYTISFISAVLLAITIKELITKTEGEDKDSKKIVLIIFISYAVICILSKLEIYTSF